MGLRRQLNTEGIAHANADSVTHARHVRQRKEQREIEWMPEVVSPDNPAAEFALRSSGLDLSKGVYFTGTGLTEKAVNGPDFEAHLAAINWERRWNYGQMKRGSKVSNVKRKRKQPAVGESVVNLAPWQMTFINGELERWEKAGLMPDKRKEMLLAWLEPLRLTAAETFGKASGWDVLGSYIHLDSNKVHFGVIHSRVGGDNHLIGEKYLRTVGPWSVAQWRIKQIGGSDPADSRLRQNFERFSERHGRETVPLDLQLHVDVDARFDGLVSTMGTDAKGRFDAAKQHYREWKAKNRQNSVVRSPSSQRIAWEVLRLVTPLLPPQVQATIRLARNASQAFQVVTTVLNAAREPERVSPSKIRQIERNI